MRFRNMVGGLAVFFLFYAHDALSQTQPTTEVEQVRQEMEQLKHDYEQRINRLEARLTKLENSDPNASVAATVPAQPATKTAPQANANSAAQRKAAAVAEAIEVQEGFQAPTDSIGLALASQQDAEVRERMEKVLREYVDISGYFRSGYGRDDVGGPQVAFQAPGALAKGRLGNEAENYGELIVGKNFYLPGVFSLTRGPQANGVSSQPVGRFQMRMSMYNPYTNYLESTSTQFGLAEAWAAVGNLAVSQPALSLWAGNRYYRRHDIYIDDFFLINMSGGGAGVEGIQTPIGKLAAAWIGLGSQSGFSDVPQPDAVNKAGFNKTNFDFRLYDFNLMGGKGELAFDVSRATSGKDQDGVTSPNATGVSFTFIHTKEKWLGDNNLNKFYAQYGRGPALTFTSGFETYVAEGQTFIRPSAPGSYRFRVADNLIFETGEHFAISPMVLYQATDYKQFGGMQYWFSAGVRPQWNFNKYASLAFEPFVDWTSDQDTKVSDYLYKITVAPQVSLGRGFMTRPTLRGFVTYAHWGNGFVGKVGGPDYATSNEGWTWGAQMEAWW